MNYGLKKPCANCPFVEANDFPLNPGRIREIGEASTFACHKTTDGETDDETGHYEHSGNEQHCFGHLVVQWSEYGGFSAMTALAARMGEFDPKQLPSADDAGCFETFDDYAEREEDR